MTIREVIAQVDGRLANTYEQKEKIDWLSQLDQRVKTLIIDTHEGAENISFSGYNLDAALKKALKTNPDADMNEALNIVLDTVLLVPAPFDDIYLRWLEAQIYYYNQEEARCNNATDAFNVRWGEFWNDYNRKHMPLGQKLSV